MDASSARFTLAWLGSGAPFKRHPLGFGAIIVRCGSRVTPFVSLIYGPVPEVSENIRASVPRDWGEGSAVVIARDKASLVGIVDALKAA